MELTLFTIQLFNAGFSLLRISQSDFVRFFSLASVSYAHNGRFLNRSLLGYHHSTVDRIRLISILFLTFQLPDQTPAFDLGKDQADSLVEPLTQRTARQNIPAAEVEKV